MKKLKGNKSNKKDSQFKYKRIVLGIDQSYQRTGISLFADKKKVFIKSIDLSKLKSNSEKRRKVYFEISVILGKIQNKAREIFVVIERIRHFSDGFLNINYIKSIGALNATIVDCCEIFDVPVYSVDTRAWKKRVIGTTKAKQNKYGVDPKKWNTVNWCIKNGWRDDILKLLQQNTRRTKGTFEKFSMSKMQTRRFEYDNDAADSAAIAMYGFVFEDGKLVLER